MASTHVDRRRRWAKACDNCRRKKLRCDSHRPDCSRCQRLSMSCHYSDVAKPNRSSVRRSLNASTNPPADEAGLGNTSSIQAHAIGIDIGDQMGVVCEDDHSFQGSSRLCARRTSNASNSVHSSLSTTSVSGTVVGKSGDMRFFGPSAWVPPQFSDPTHCKPSGQHTPKEPLRPKGSWSRWTHPSVQSILEKRVKKPLPPWIGAFSLVSEFFEQDHKEIPCLHPPTFMTLLGQQYSDTSEESPAWWVALNAVLAISQRRRVETGRSPLAEQDLAWGYAANALGSTFDVLMRSSDLLSVQALLAIAWFFIGTPNPQPAFMFVGSALRLAYSIGLHKNDCHSNLGSIEKETRTKVFWVAVRLDSQLCLQTGRPPAHDLYTFPFELPTANLEDDADTLKAADGSTISILRVQVQLALIQDCISRKLSSATTSENNSTLTQDCVSGLNRQLDEWCCSLPPPFRPGSSLDHEHHCTLKRLHASYYHSVIVANRSHSREYWKALGHPTSLEPTSSVSASVHRCLTAARAITSISGMIPHSWKELSWNLLPLNVTAIIALSFNIIRNPQTDNCEADLEAILCVLQLFDAMDKEDSNTYLPYLRIGCQNLFQMAKEASTAYITRQSRPQHRGYVGPDQIGANFDDHGVALEDQQSHSIQSATLAREGPISMPSRLEYRGALSSFDMGQRGEELSSANWDGTEQTPQYPILSDWGLDMLLDGNLTAWM